MVPRGAHKVGVYSPEQQFCLVKAGKQKYSLSFLWGETFFSSDSGRGFACSLAQSCFSAFLFICLLFRVLCVCVLRRWHYFWKHSWNSLNTNVNWKDKTPHTCKQAHSGTHVHPLFRGRKGVCSFWSCFKKQLPLQTIFQNPLNVLRSCQQPSIVLSQIYLTICIFGLGLICFRLVPLSPRRNSYGAILPGEYSPAPPAAYLNREQTWHPHSSQLT